MRNMFIATAFATAFALPAFASQPPTPAACAGIPDHREACLSASDKLDRDLGALHAAGLDYVNFIDAYGPAAAGSPTGQMLGLDYINAQDAYEGDLQRFYVQFGKDKRRT